jgi:predicted nucleic acid-binding protein
MTLTSVAQGESEWVVDASVALPLFINGPQSEAAHTFFARLADDPPTRLHVPDLFYIEVANVLWKYVRWHGLPQAQAQEYLRQLGRLALHATPTAELMGDALELAVTYSISAYDACYLALARRLDIPLVTSDGKLAAAIADPTQVRLLSDLQFP